MRITSGMISNNMILNVNRHMRNLDTLWGQASTKKKINVASDNPLIAARAMKFHTSLSVNESHINNTESGLAWMEVTEASIDNVLQVLLNEARDLLTRSPNDTLTLSDRQSLINNLRNLHEQIGLEMNMQFAGRYVFSGLRTDEPPTFTIDNKRSFNINQTFNLRDVERTESLHISEPVSGIDAEMPIIHSINVLKLPYRNLDLDAVTGQPRINIPGFNIIMRQADHPDAYVEPPSGTVVYIPQTGELLFNGADVTGPGAEFNFPAPEREITINYTKTGFSKGELNPIVYFDAVQRLTTFSELDFFDDAFQVPQGSFIKNTGIAPGTIWPVENSFTIAAPYTIKQTLTSVNGGVKLAYQNIDVPSHAAPNFNFFPATINGITFSQGAPANVHEGPNMLTPAQIEAIRSGLADGEFFLDQTTGMLYMNDDTAVAFRSVTITYEKETFRHTDTVPTANIEVTATPGNFTNAAGQIVTVPFYIGFSHNMDNQNLIYEFSTRATVPVNTLAKNVNTAQLYSDFRRLIEFVDSINPNTEAVLRAHYAGPPTNYAGDVLDKAVADHMSDENAFISDVLNQRLNNMLFLVDRHAADARRELTDIGSRGRRLELFQNRLEDNEGAYFKIMSSNEDIDMGRLSTLIATAQTQYMAALQIGSNILSVTLGNFLQV